MTKKALYFEGEKSKLNNSSKELGFGIFSETERSKFLSISFSLQIVIFVSMWVFAELNRGKRQIK